MKYDINLDKGIWMVNAQLYFFGFLVTLVGFALNSWVNKWLAGAISIALLFLSVLFYGVVYGNPRD